MEEDQFIPPYENVQTKVKLEDFEMVKVIGQGSYGKVVLVKKINTKEILAMKILRKQHIRKKNQIQRTNTERHILEQINHPFIVRLKYAFQNKKKLYFIMDYCPGGELFFHICRLFRLPEDRAKFQAAQVVLCLEHIHANNIIYRDLKPENVLVDVDGQIKLTDFGLSKENIFDNQSTNSFCGTTEYLAPEIIQRTGHGKAVDWWTLGCFLQEMLTGSPPFSHKDRNRVFSNIQKLKLEYPNYLSNGSIIIMQDLLVVDPNKRLGGNNGAEAVKRHKWFSDIKWDLLIQKKLKPPYIPKLKHNVDTGHFEQYFTNMEIQESVGLESAQMSNFDKDFDEFSYNCINDINIKN